MKFISAHKQPLIALHFNAVSMDSQENVSELRPVAKTLRHSDEKITAGHTSVRRDNDTLSPLYSKLFLQVLSIVRIKLSSL